MTTRALLVISFLLLCATLSTSQSLTNIAVHTDVNKKQAEAYLTAARDTGGTIHAVVLYRNQSATFQKIGHWYSSNEGSSWPTGGDSLPSDNGAQNDPTVAFDVSRGYAYATFLTSTARYLSYSTDWGATWNATGTQSTIDGADAPVIAVDNDQTSSYAGTAGDRQGLAGQQRFRGKHVQWADAVPAIQSGHAAQ